MIMVDSGIPAYEAAGARSITSHGGYGPGLGASGNMGNFAHFNERQK